MLSGMSLETSVQPVVCALAPTVMVNVYATRVSSSFSGGYSVLVLKKSVSLTTSFNSCSSDSVGFFSVILLPLISVEDMIIFVLELYEISR